LTAEAAPAVLPQQAHPGPNRPVKTTQAVEQADNLQQPQALSSERKTQLTAEAAAEAENAEAQAEAEAASPASGTEARACQNPQASVASSDSATLRPTQPASRRQERAPIEVASVAYFPPALASPGEDRRPNHHLPALLPLLGERVASREAALDRPTATSAPCPSSRWPSAGHAAALAHRRRPWPRHLRLSYALR